MILIFLIVVPLLAGIFSFAAGNNGKTLALVSSLVTLGIAGYLSAYSCCDTTQWSMEWIPRLGTQLSLMADGMGAMLCLLTAIVMLVVFIVNWNKEVEKPGAFYGLMLLSQAGITGVFLANDALLFYFFWELALIPVYFLCSQWGGERRVPVTFKFFVYTFVGSLMMLAGLIYLSLQTPGADAYSWANIVRAGSSLPAEQQQWVFWLIFIAFAIKMPIFPFHTWQPDTYEQSPTPVTIILSALMVKMGMFATLRWLIPVVPEGVAFWSETVIILSIIGIVYASCLAIVQTDLKRLIAYSSIAHMGLMSAAAFSQTQVGVHGLMVQMFNHGINIAGLWLIVSMVEQRWGTRDMTKLGGMAITAPLMAISLVIISLANIALPLTNGFIGEFMLFNGLFQSASSYSMVFMVIAGLGIILGAVYTLNMVQRTAYGNAVAAVVSKDLTVNEYIGLAIVIALIIVLGVYPAPLLDMTATAASVIVP
ncbi:complex I subunit 4 family protein [Polluticoccus soli]|uniref:complex I subunit 4 family protein n=1 Tax=Polluticoccus soli TaxID=3034150 RepID=UPI0023E0C32B|nr:NADH-quinone oxidoreductase subunit M [Flavipsychrobacter sp. JY13-12]